MSPGVYRDLKRVEGEIISDLHASVARHTSKLKPS